MTANKFTGVVLLIVFGLYGYHATGFERALSVDIVGPQLFPIIIAIVGSALAALLLVQDHLKKTEDPSTAELVQLQFGIELEKLVPWLLMLAYVFLLYLFGFYVASFIFLVSLGWWLGIRSPVKLVIYAVSVVAVSALLFRTALHMLLPESTLALSLGL